MKKNQEKEMIAIYKKEMIAIYKKVPEEEILKESKGITQRVKQFFKTNPKRKVCRIGLWYDKSFSIRRGHVDEDLTKAFESYKQT